LGASLVRVRRNWKGWQAQNLAEMLSAAMPMFSGIIILMQKKLRLLTSLIILKSLPSMRKNGTMACVPIAKPID
jgi:hypothetical protein